eukprot:4915625-Pyramimonas_sp.AAC.1
MSNKSWNWSRNAPLDLPNQISHHGVELGKLRGLIGSVVTEPPLRSQTLLLASSRHGVNVFTF